MKGIFLYNYFRSSTSYRVRAALHLKGIDFSYRAVHLLQNGGEQHAAAFRELNPSEGVPVLVHDEVVVAQSMAILEYLEDAFPQQPRLLPNDAVQRALVRQLCQIIACDIHPLANLRVTQHLMDQYKIDEPAKNAWIRHWVTRGLAATESLLSKTSGTYCVGNELTMADLFLVSQYFSAQRFQVSFTETPLVAEISQRLEALPAVAKAHPYRQPDTPSELKI